MKIIVFILSLLFSFTSYCQINWQWANAINSTQDEKTLDVATVLSTGETYACGYFNGDLSSIYLLGLNGTPDFSAPLGNRDGFVSKYDATGNIIWAFKIGGVGATVEVEAITVAPNGNIYVTGEFFSGSVDFQGVASSISSVRTPTGTSKNMFLAAYNSDGELLWATSSTDTGNSIGNEVTADVNGIYVVGSFTGNITFPPLSPKAWSGFGSYSDAYITKFDFSGNAIDVKTIFSTIGDGDVKGLNVATYGTNVYAIGTSSSLSWTYGPTGFNPTNINNGIAGTEDIWVISFRENNFNLNWSQTIGSIENDIAKGIAVDANGIYLTGGLGGSAINFPGVLPVPSIGTAKDIFSCKLFSASGLTDWVFTEQNFSVVDTYGSDIVIDAAGNLFITGSHTGTTDFNGGSNTILSYGGLDVFVMSRKNTGAFNWVKSAGSTGNDEALGVGYDDFGNVYVGGYYNSASTFGSLSLPNDLLPNGFIGKLSSCASLPSISCPPNQTVAANSSCQYTLTDYTSTAVVTAPCGVLSVKQVPIVGTVIDSGVNGVTLYLTDLSGNIDSCSFTVTVNDSANPTLGCPADVNISCPAIVNSIAPINPADNCGIDSVSYVLTGATTGAGLNDASGTFFNDGVTTVTYTITDLSGNIATCSFTVTVEDTTIPTLNCPADVNIDCPAIVNSIAPINSADNCGIDSVSYVLTGATTGAGLNDASGTFFNVGVTTVTYTITDLSGNIATCSFTVTVEDTTIPTLNCPADVNIDCPAIVNSIAPISPADNCGIDSVSYVLTGATTGTGLNDASGTFFNVGVTTITYAITDLSGNTASCNFTVTVADVTSPTIVCGSDVTEYLDLNCGFEIPDYTGTIINLSDNCTDSSSIVLSQFPTQGTIISGHGFTQTITLYATDDFINVDSCSFTLTLVDTISPTIVCFGDTTVNTNASCQYVLPVYSPISLTDNCAVLGDITITQSPIAGTIISTNTLVTLIANDGNGNVDSCSFNVLLNDSINPTVICPNDTVVSNDIGSCDAFVTMGIPVATDNCGISSVINSFNNSNNASDTYLLGTTAVTWVVTDNTSNTGTCTFNVTVIDTEFPEITCISDTIINTDNGICGALFTYSITTLDNCSSTLSQTNGLTSGTIFPIGNTTNTYETVDLAGNTSTCTFNVMVIDNELPSIICPNNIVVCEENITITQPVVSDNCVITSLLNDFNNSSDASGLYPIGNTTINWIVTDSSGNTNSCLMNVQRDELPSVANAGEDQNVILNLPVTFDANVPTVGSGTWSLVSGDGSITNWSDPHAQVVDLMPGENIFTWTITNGVCPETYDEVIIHSLGLEIPTGFSPNGDNVNDKLEIIGIENLASELIIFNRWGVEVFSTSNYQNNWDGTSNKGMPLPEDTYFYILKLTELDVQENGYIVLKR